MKHFDKFILLFMILVILPFIIILLFLMYLQITNKLDIFINDIKNIHNIDFSIKIINKSKKKKSINNNKTINNNNNNKQKKANIRIENNELDIMEELTLDLEEFNSI